MEPLEGALWYASAGVPVLPLHTGLGGGRCSCRRPHCDRPGKHPRWHPRLITAGLHEASTDPEQVRRWWAAWPEANVGLRTGVAVDVCDVDTPAGLHLLRDLIGDALETPLVQTGSGGLHLYFVASGAPNRVRLLPGVDWRGEGGYVVAPPSTHGNGMRYRWISHGPAPPCPPALLRLVIPPPPPPPAVVRHPGRYAAAALDNEVTRVRFAQVGERNNTLYRAARSLGRLVASGLLDPYDVVSALTPAALAAGLGSAETARTIHSGLTAGRGRRVA